MASMKTLFIIFVIMFPVAMITEEDVNHGVCPVPMNKEEEEFIKERERNRELMEEIAREIEMTCSDECTTGLHNCHNDAYCTNTKHSFTCTCKAGYTGDGVNNCADINECHTGEHNCDVTSSLCYNTMGSFGCACKEGYSKNGEDNCTESCPNMAILTGTSGIITSPSYPGNYGNNHNCNWKIMASTGNRVKLVIQDMDIESGTNCPYDYIEIQNAVIYGSGVLPERLCGSLNSSSTFSSYNETLILRLVTDDSLTARGFKARFTVIPDGEDM